MADKNVQIIISAKDKTSEAFKSVAGGLSRIQASGANIVTAFAGVATALGAVGGVGLKMASEFEQTSVAFRTMVGDAEQAGALLTQLSKFAAETPFEFPEIATAGKQLMAFGTSAGDITGQLKMLGDLASGLGVPLSQLTYAFGQVQVSGKLMGGDLMQFTNAGVPLIAELSRVLGVSQGAVKDMVSEWKVGFPQVQQALMNLTSEGWKFAGMMANQSKTMSGLFSTVKDNLGALAREIVGISNDWTVRVGSLFETLREGLADAIGWIEENKGIIIDISNNIFTGLAQTFTAFRDFVVAVFSSVLEVWNSVLDAFGINTNAVTKDTAVSWSNFFKYVSAGIQIVALGFKNAFAWIKMAFKMLLSWLHLTAGGLIGLVVGAVGAALKPIQGLINSAIDGVNVVLKAVGKSAIANVSFADKMGQVGAGILMKSWNVATDDMSDNWDAFTSDVSNNTSATMAKLDGIMSSFGNNTKTELKTVNFEAGKMPTAFTEAGEKAKGASKKIKDASDEIKKAEQERYARIKASMDEAFGQLDKRVSDQKNKVAGLKDDYVKLKDKLSEIGTKGAEDLKKISDELDKQARKISDISGEGKSDVAKRAVEARKELESLMKQEAPKTGEELNDRTAQANKLKAEIALGEQYAGNKAIQDATAEAQKSETQLIIDKTAKKLAEAEAERMEIQKTYDAKKASIDKETADIVAQMETKKALIISENETYKSLITERKRFDNEYFTLFGAHIAKQIAKTKEAIAMMKELSSAGGLPNGSGIAWARADGWPVSGGKTYLVGERWPELFTPSRSGQIIPNGGSGVTLNVSIGNVSANDRGQVDYLVNRIKTELTREIQLAKLGIA